VRERKAEIKKMDKKVKQQETMSDELSELRTRNEQLDKDLENVRKEQRDERKKTQREKQQLLDAKKQLQQDLAASSAELETLAKQVEERTAAARKAEHR
jgi:NAD+--asparagine ADP-ribosyltransferase